MDEKDSRRRYSPEQKFKIIKEQLTTKTSISQICEKYDISATNFYRWQDEFFEGALQGLQRAKDGPTKAELRKIEALEKDNNRMKDVISEIISENIIFKKKLGE
ncbi:MAG TPA: transposase [Petrotogaceae bacterium]|nr:transposase [Petrotogaceae bacterium]